jgi:hypothetical protein
VDEFTIQLAKQIAVEVVKQLRTADDSWVSQADSDLGPRKHCRIVREMIARGCPGATIAPGGRYLLHPEVYADERLQMGRSVVKAVPANDADGDEATAIRSRLNRKLGIV